MNGFSERCEIGNEVIIVDPDHLLMSFSGRMDIHMSGDDKPHTTLCQLLIQRVYLEQRPTLGVG
jgi:hypothetical protein